MCICVSCSTSSVTMETLEVPAGRYMVKRIQMAGENVHIVLNTIADLTLGILNTHLINYLVQMNVRNVDLM